MRVHVAQAVKSEISAWSRKEGKEIGGILLGSVQHRGDSVGRVRVEAAILAAEADTVGSSIRLTPELVATLTRKAEVKYPTFEVVGWFHSHHGLGAFLSSYDIGVHKENFPSPWQIAFVFDPVLGQEAIYVGGKDDLVPYENDSSGYYDLIPTRLSGNRYRLVNPKRFLAAIALLVVLVVAVTGLWRWATEPAGTLETGELPTQQSGRLEQDIDPKLTNEPDPPVLEVEPNNHLLDETIHIVQPNDTLWGISENYYGDGSYFGLIVDRNNISDPRELEPGQRLVLPPLPEGNAETEPGAGTAD
jgi:nucleoid-associated protein YgaU